MGKTGQKGGNLYAQNFQMGSVGVATNQSGNGSASVTFRQTMRKIPNSVVLSPMQSGSEKWTTGVLTPTAITKSGFTVVIRSCSETDKSVKVAYSAADDTYN